MVIGERLFSDGSQAVTRYPDAPMTNRVAFKYYGQAAPSMKTFKGTLTFPDMTNSDADNRRFDSEVRIARDVSGTRDNGVWCSTKYVFVNLVVLAVHVDGLSVTCCSRKIMYHSGSSDLQQRVLLYCPFSLRILSVQPIHLGTSAVHLSYLCLGLHRLHSPALLNK